MEQVYVTREAILEVENAFNNTRCTGEKFFSELPEADRVRMVEVATRYATRTTDQAKDEEIARLRVALGELVAACDGEPSEVFAAEIGRELDIATKALGGSNA